MKNTDLNTFDQIQLKDFITKKRRRAFLWGAGIAAIAVSTFWMFGESDGYPEGPQIARVNIDGVILSDTFRDDMMNALADEEGVKAVMLYINSGGGAVYPSEKLYRQIRRIAEDVPVVAIMEGAAASGAYISALGADYLIAGDTTITASIGVIADIPDYSGALEKLGISTTVIRSSDVKGGISTLRKPTELEIQAEQKVIDEIYDWFRDLVGERRGLSGNALAAVANGTVATGRQAFEAGLVDEIGDEMTARAYLEELQPELADLDVELWEPNYPIEDNGFVNVLTNKVVETLYEKSEELSLPRFQ